jgi:hypothetical protein
MLRGKAFGELFAKKRGTQSISLEREVLPVSDRLNKVTMPLDRSA